MSTGNLPPSVTRFVGRDLELSRLTGLIGETSLVTLVGPGGCGKTRLALELAERNGEAYDGGCWFVDLSISSSGESLPSLVGSILGMPPTTEPVSDQLANRFSETRSLLILDNCEHLVDDVAELADSIVRRCPQVRLLATSREPLGVQGENVYRVGSLTQADAVSLFWDRARAAAAETDLSEFDRDTIATLCERLDGIPLALELAASCMGAMTPQALLRRLDERFVLLVGGRRANPRHRTLRAAIEWSEELLALTERRVFHRLGVFVGGFDLTAAEAVAAGEELSREQVMPVLRRLVERSMVMIDREAGHDRYRLLDTLRDFAVERLVAERDAERTRSAHAEHFAREARESVAGEGSGRVHDAEAVRAARRSLGLDLGNYRAAMEYTRSIRSPLLATLAIHLNPLWYGVTGPQEGRHWLEAALAVVPPEDRGTRMGLAESLSAVSIASGDLAAARSYRREFIVLVEGSVEPREQWAGLLTLAQLEASEDTRSALAAADRALEVARSLGEPEALVQSLMLGSMLRRCDSVELDRAQALEDEAASMVESVEDQVTRSVLDRMIKEQLVESQVAGGDSEAGLRFYRGLLSAEAEVLEPDWYDYPYLASMARVAALLVRTGRPARAVRLAGAIDQACDQRGFAVAGLWGDDHREMEDAIRAMGARGRALHESGRKMPIADAKAYAIEDAQDDLLAAVRLTPREREVADFVRQGLTDGEIAARLVLSVRTVEGHVENLRGKLSVNTRAGVAAWAAVNLP